MHAIIFIKCQLFVGPNRVCMDEGVVTRYQLSDCHSLYESFIHLDKDTCPWTDMSRGAWILSR